MSLITTIHGKVLDHFVNIRRDNPDFFFSPRLINNKGRLDKGFWFLGNEYYLHISFWNGKDWKEKIHNIGFVIHDDSTCKIELSAQDSTEKATFLKKIVSKISGFEKDKNKNKWYKYLDEEKNYLELIDEFLKTDKLIIDKLIRDEKPGILPLDTEYYNKYINPVIERRKQQIEFGKANKLTRITWNTEKWQRPSGPSGKSVSRDSYEAKTGFGNEEWLLDKISIIEGYHYAFIQSLNLETDKHVGSSYNITLFTINNLGKKYEVGAIDNVECISGEESERIFSIYMQRGWLDKMETDLSNVNADVKTLKNANPVFFFNLRFRFENARIHDELLEISSEDVNITTKHFKLLPQKTQTLELVEIEIDKDENEQSEESSGKTKNTAPRKKIFNVESEYDPYHDKLQNFLFELLKTGYDGYHNVKIEHSHVDIKAMHENGKWHYFEIKTDGPKLSIRKALGQVMEYAFFPSLSRAEKLIIIADKYPDDDAIAYLKYIRLRFDLPVYYRALNLYERTLSKEF